MSRAGKSTETESRGVVAMGWGRGLWGVVASGAWATFWGDRITPQ